MASKKKRLTKKQRRKIVMRNRLIAAAVLLVIIVVIIILIVSCSKNSAAKNTAEIDQTAFEIQTTSDETASDESENETTEAETWEDLPEQTFGNWDLSMLSGEKVPYGFNWDDLDENGVPSGVEYYKSLYGQFRADFISDRTDKTIYLTMDEGTVNEETADILDILKEKNVKATFFCTSEFVEECPDLIERMISEGHRIGSHSITHQRMPRLSLETQEEEIMDVVNKMKETYNYDVRLFRFPTGEFCEQSLALVENLGLKSVFWSFAYDDYSEEQPDVQESLENALDCLHPGAIYLLHAASSTNQAMLSDFIDGVREAGYEFGGVYPVD